MGTGSNWSGVMRVMLAGSLAVIVVALTLPAAWSDDPLSRLKAAGVLRVANTQASPPWSLLDERNQPAGYDIDVALDLARRLGIPKVSFIQSTFADFIPGVQSDRYDIVISGQTITDERLKQVDFSVPYEVNGVAIFVGSSNQSLKTLADLSGRRIGVTAGGTQETFARESIPRADVRTYSNAILALTDLHVGRIDAALYSKFTGAFLAERHGLKVRPLPTLLNYEVNGMSFKKGQADLKAAVDNAVVAMIADGTLTKISKKWLGGLDMAADLTARGLVKVK
ncbi:MAG TPA: transporter substrate-binding domain-containing protein [bacterium]|nr:transporter substrate-binding domain-containing protein [bacterium]